MTLSPSLSGDLMNASSCPIHRFNRTLRAPAGQLLYSARRASSDFSPSLPLYVVYTYACLIFGQSSARSGTAGGDLETIQGRSSSKTRHRVPQCKVCSGREGDRDLFAPRARANECARVRGREAGGGGKV